MTRSVSANGAATVLMLLSGCSHRIGDDRLTAGNLSPVSGAAEENHSALPVAGAYGFTEGQAKSRLEASGYSAISGLEKTNSGIWRGQAEKNGVPVSVQLLGAQ